MKIFELKLSNKEFIRFTSYTDLEKIDGCDFVNIFFFDFYNKYYLYDQAIHDALESFSYGIKKALKNNSKLDSINENIGYAFNKFLHATVTNKLKKIKQINYGFVIWESSTSKPKLKTWLYNDSEGNIIIYIGEIYFWHFHSNYKSKNYITYDQFMKNYKPIFSRIIPHQIARQWLAQCEYLLATIKKNEEHETHEHKLAVAHDACKECLLKK